MKTVNKIFLSLLLSFMLIISSVVPIYGASIDNKFIDMVFDKLETMDSEFKEYALNMLKDYFYNDNSLNMLKDDLPTIFKMFLGDDYESKLAEKGLSIDEIKAEIDNMKKWSQEDRYELLELAKNNDKAGVIELLKKHETNSGPSQGGGGISSSSAPEETNPIQPLFTDIQNHWAKKDIEFMAAKGILKGKGEKIFAPDDNVTRAEFTIMLVRLLDLKATSTTLPFNDVSEKDWYYTPILAAYSNGLAKGTGASFNPKGLITREEMVMLIRRAATIKSKTLKLDNIDVEQQLSNFKDRDEIAEWAKADCAKAVKQGLVKGVSADLFAPKSTATRAQAATIMCNLYNLTGE